MKRILLAWSGSFLLMFSLSGLFNTFIIRGFVEENISSELLRNPPNLALIALGYVALSLIMTLIYPRLQLPKAFSPIRAIGFGMVIGIIWLFPYSLVLHGVYNFPVAALFLDTGWALIEQGTGGLIVGYVYKTIHSTD